MKLTFEWFVCYLHWCIHMVRYDRRLGTLRKRGWMGSVLLPVGEVGVSIGPLFLRGGKGVCNGWRGSVYFWNGAKGWGRIQ